MSSINNVVSFDQASTGYQWAWQHVYDEEKWYDWYLGNYKDLFTGARNIQNALGFLNPNQNGTLFNYFRASSGFYQHALLGESPSITSRDTRKNDWIQTNYADIIKALQQGVKWWSIKARCVFFVSRGQLRAVDPSNYFPVVSPWDTDFVVGHIFAYPYYSGKRETNNSFYIPDTIRFVKYSEMENVNRIETYRLEGTSVGQLLSTQDANIDGVYSIDTDDGYYGNISTIVREIMVRQAAIQSTLNTTVFPILQLDVTDIGDKEFEDKPLSPERLNLLNTRGLGVLIQPPTRDEGDNKYIERSGTGLAEAFEYYRILFSQLSIISGVPPLVFGVDLGRSASQDERERLLFSAQSRVSTMRRAVEDGVISLINYMTSIPGDVEVNWVNEPFASINSRQNQVINQYVSQLISLQEARAALGYKGDIPQELLLRDFLQQSPNTSEQDAPRVPRNPEGRNGDAQPRRSLINRLIGTNNPADF